MKNAETWRLLEDKIGSALANEPHSIKRQYDKGEVVYDQGGIPKHIHVVLSGRFRVTMTRTDGFEFLLEIMGPGALMGEGPALDGLPRYAAATALEESQLLQFPVARLPEAFARNPELAIDLLTVTAVKQRNLANRLLSLTAASPKARIAEMLFRISGTYGLRSGGHILVETKLSHEQIAALVGVTRVTVTRAMQELTAAGILRIDETSIQILDAHRLHEFSLI